MSMHTESENRPLVLGDDRVHTVKIERIYFLDQLDYYTSRTGRTVAVRLRAAARPGQLNAPMVSPRVYIERGDILPDATEQMLVNLSTHRLFAWKARAQAKFWHEGLIQACRPYRETHRGALRAVATHMVGRFGSCWWESEEAQSLALSTLRTFGVSVQP